MTNPRATQRFGPYLILDKNREDSAPKSVILSLRITPELRAELDRAASGGPYRIGVTALVERGIVLAIRELDELAERIK